MIGQIVEISTDNKFLSVDRGCLSIKENGKEVGKVPFDLIQSLIISGHGISYSNNVLVKLSEQNSPIVICNQKYLPVAILLPIQGNYNQALVMDSQIKAKEPLKKQLWRDIVTNKLQQQAGALKILGKNYKIIEELSKNVKSGDITNKEAEGARKYFQILFGKEFKRDRELNGINSLLNYGYIILRSATARAIVASGLYPTLGLHHKNQYNPFRLADDLMEPFRPFVDLLVYNLLQKNQLELNKETKLIISNILSENIQAKSGCTELNFCIQTLATSLAQIFLGNRKKLELPYIISDGNSYATK